MSGMPAFDGRRAGLWLPYTPTTTGFTQGASTISGRWRPDIGQYRIKVVFGTGFAILGAGATFSFPFTLAPESRDAGADVRVVDTGSNSYRFIANQGASAVVLYAVGADGAYGSVWPFDPVAGDYLIIAGGGEVQS